MCDCIECRAEADFYAKIEDDLKKNNKQKREMLESVCANCNGHMIRLSKSVPRSGDPVLYSISSDGKEHFWMHLYTKDDKKCKNPKPVFEKTTYSLDQIKPPTSKYIKEKTTEKIQYNLDD